VWICAGTPIKLVWDSTNADSIEITPDLGQQALKGEQIIPDATSPNPKLHLPRTHSTEYRARARRGDFVIDDSVTVNVIAPGGEEFSQKATYVDGHNFWMAHLPDHTYDPRIRVAAMIIDTGHANSVTHPGWRVDHHYNAMTPVATMLPLLDTRVPVGDRHPLPGEYRLTPQPSGAALPPNERDLDIYFRVFVEACET
jgi:hypothetical protein